MDTKITDLESLKASTRATITRAEAAAVLGVDVRTLGRAIEEGDIPSIAVARRVLVLREPFLAMLLGHTERAA